MMKNTILQVALALSCSCALWVVPVAANATPAQAVASHTPSAEIQFGSYVTVAGYTALPNQAVMATAPVAAVGAMNIYANPSEPKPQAVISNVVVQNIATGEFGLVTGRLAVLTEHVESLNAALEPLGLTALKSVEQGQLQLLEAPAGADLLQLSEKLAALAGVKVVKIDVLEQLNTPQ